MRIDWASIDTVLLDMDGTLIDRKIEDRFWNEIVPREYAKKQGLTFKEAKNDFFRKSDVKEHLPDWGNISHWEKDLDIKLRDIRNLEISKTKLHPHTLRFLKFLKKQKKKIYLVTGSDPEDTQVKLTFTKMLDYFDGIYTQPGFGESKSTVGFWKKLQKELHFNSSRTILADDNINVLRAAQKFGIKWLVFKTIHSSVLPAHKPNELICVRHFDDVLKD